jgi:hypothetical protein
VATCPGSLIVHAHGTIEGERRAHDEHDRATQRLQRIRAQVDAYDQRNAS